MNSAFHPRSEIVFVAIFRQNGVLIKNCASLA